jgi:hypothetical protein
LGGNCHADEIFETIKTNEQRTDRMKNQVPIKKAGLSEKDPPAYERFVSSGFR